MARVMLRGFVGPVLRAVVPFRWRRSGVVVATALLLVAAVGCGGDPTAAARAAPGPAGQTGSVGPSAAATQTRAAQVPRTPPPGPNPEVRTPTLAAPPPAVRDCYVVDGRNQGIALTDTCVSAQARDRAVHDCQPLVAAQRDGCVHQWARYVQAAQDHQLLDSVYLCLAADGTSATVGTTSPSTRVGNTCQVGNAPAGRTVDLLKN